MPVPVLRGVRGEGRASHAEPRVLPSRAARCGPSESLAAETQEGLTPRVLGQHGGSGTVIVCSVGRSHGRRGEHASAMVEVTLERHHERNARSRSKLEWKVAGRPSSPTTSIAPTHLPNPDRRSSRSQPMSRSPSRRPAQPRPPRWPRTGEQDQRHQRSWPHDERGADLGTEGEHPVPTAVPGCAAQRGLQRIESSCLRSKTSQVRILSGARAKAGRQWLAPPLVRRAVLIADETAPTRAVVSRRRARGASTGARPAATGRSHSPRRAFPRPGR
jgi:hypothetical protein